VSSVELPLALPQNTLKLDGRSRMGSRFRHRRFRDSL
jgi:hypothetical protein